MESSQKCKRLSVELEKFIVGKECVTLFKDNVHVIRLILVTVYRLCQPHFWASWLASSISKLTILSPQAFKIGNILFLIVRQRSTGLKINE